MSLPPLNTITLKAIVIGSTCKTSEVDRNTLKSCTPHDMNIRNQSRIGTPTVNKGVFSRRCLKMNKTGLKELGR